MKVLSDGNKIPGLHVTLKANSVMGIRVAGHKGVKPSGHKGVMARQGSKFLKTIMQCAHRANKHHNEQNISQD